MSESTFRMSAFFTRKKRDAAAALLMTSVFALGLVGCAAPTGGPTEVPVGHWEGKGAFVCDAWPEGAAAYSPAESKAKRRTYPTTFVSERVERDGVELTRVEIVSVRGSFQDEDDDRTHLVLYLHALRAVDDDAVLMDLASWEASTTEKPPEEAGKPEIPVSATCLRRGDELAVQIRYMEGFTDHWVFSGDTLRKYGVYHPGQDDQSQGFVHWAETLKRVK